MAHAECIGYRASLTVVEPQIAQIPAALAEDARRQEEIDPRRVAGLGEGHFVEPLPFRKPVVALLRLDGTSALGTSGRRGGGEAAEGHDEH